jgi:hypothetical protein
VVRVTTPLLSAAIIVKDEAHFLRNCLTSISEVLDEIVVVDTGSADDSIEVARSFGAVQGLHPWGNDFAAARNTALDLATGRWILYIDADEQLKHGDAAAMRDELESSTDAVSLRVWFRTRPIWSPYREYRLWQHRPDIRFNGRIHETMVPDITRVASTEGLAIRGTELFRIVHFGYEGDRTAKHHRNLPMLELIHRITERFPDPPVVYYRTSHWTDAQMLGLAARPACTLSLTASEGWGLGTFDAAALGVSAIITGYGGQAEYLRADYPGLVPYRRVKTTHSDRDLFERRTEWAYADMDVAVDMLRSVVSGLASPS